MPRRLPVRAGVVGLLLTGFLASPAAANPDVPVPVTGPDQRLTTSLDSVVAISPADTCLSVSVDGTSMYDHRGTDLQIPASTQKLTTGAAALAALGDDHVFTTRLVSTAPVVDGVVQGDVVLVGGGDPGLVTNLYRTVRKIGTTTPVTVLDELGTSLAAAGVRRIEGRVLADESRWDSARTVASWPDRYVRQNQSGPLGAADVNDGYELSLDADGGVVRKRSDDPPRAAAAATKQVLEGAGIVVTGDVGASPAPAAADAVELAAVTSPPLADVVGDMLRRSDNQTAESLTKELGVASAGAGTTASGAEALAAWQQSEAATAPGTVVVDGSGLDYGNQATCDQLLRTLGASGGPTGTIAAGLPVAGESGTLRARFTDTAADGVLRAKTGSLNDVSSLAGFVTLPDGGTASFAYVANGEPITREVLAAQDLLAQILATYEPPCPAGEANSIVTAAPSALAADLTATSGPLGIGGQAIDAVLTALDSRPNTVVDRCSAERGVTLGLAGK